MPVHVQSVQDSERLTKVGIGISPQDAAQKTVVPDAAELLGRSVHTWASSGSKTDVCGQLRPLRSGLAFSVVCGWGVRAVFGQSSLEPLNRIIHALSEDGLRRSRAAVRGHSRSCAAAASFRAGSREIRSPAGS